MNSQPPAARRLKASLSGTNLELTGDYNQRLVYQTIRSQGPTTRNALVELTGLAKPTIAGIVRRLLGSELVLETSRIYGRRGQPAGHLEINAQGSFSIGLQVSDDRMQLIAVDALGVPVNRTASAIAPGQGARTGGFSRAQFLELTRDIRRERIIGMGVAVAGGGGEENAPGDAAIGIDVLALSNIAPGVPVYIESDLTAATAGESLFGMGGAFQSYYYILMDAVPVGGMVLHQALFKGAHPNVRRLLFPDAELGWCREAVAAERSAGDAPPVPAHWLAVASDAMLPLLSAINCMLNPGGVLLGGRFPREWLEALAERCNTLLRERAPEIPSHAGIRAAALATEATLIGAASLPVRARLFPIGEALLKTPDHGG